MSTPLSDLETEALKLPLQERARLADRLLASVYTDREIDEPWAAEVERRLAAVEAGSPLVEVPVAVTGARSMTRRSTR